MEDKIKNKNGKLEKTNKKEKMEKLHKKDKKVSALRLYCHYISIHVRSTMQYKTTFFLTTLGQFLFSFNVFVGITCMFQRFHEVKGFTYSEVLRLFWSNFLWQKCLPEVLTVFQAWCAMPNLTVC